jgi:hypothetical protein
MPPQMPRGGQNRDHFGPQMSLIGGVRAANEIRITDRTIEVEGY